MLPQQIDGALGQRVALVPPALPADVGMHVVSFEANSVEHANGLGKDLVANAVSGHAYDGVFCHDSNSSVTRYSHNVGFAKPL